ncbi:MAG TPA: hypothetical protein V6D18_15530, partial [Thermosynechococcaceae cyanobacterium]
MAGSSPWNAGRMFLLSAGIVLSPTVAMASSYVSTSGSTRLLLNDKTGYVQYQTLVNGKIWSGEASPGRILGQNGNRTIYSSFKDFPGQSLASQDKAQSVCSGDFIALQTVNNDRYVLEAT